MKLRIIARTLLAAALVMGIAEPLLSADLPRIVIARDKQGFAIQDTDTRFSPWGFNYDHDETGRLIEDYWNSDWEMSDGISVP